MQLLILCGRVQGAQGVLLLKPRPFLTGIRGTFQHSFIMHDRVSSLTTFQTENLNYVRKKQRQRLSRRITLDSTGG